MTDIHLSRRKVLAGLGTIGIASAGAGLGTTAFFSDEESLEGSLEAGRLDLLLDYRVTYNPWLTLAELEGREDELFGGNPYVPIEGVDYDDMETSNDVLVGQTPDLRTAEGLGIPGNAWAKLTKDGLDACVDDDAAAIEATLDGFADPYPTYQVYDGDEDDYIGAARPYVDGEDGVLFDLTDVKPKDEGEATISLHLCDNRGYISLRALPAVDLDRENDVVEPENVDGYTDDDTDGELANYIWVQVWFDEDCSNTVSGDETPLYQGSLAGMYEMFAEGGRLAGDLEGGCFSPGVHCLGFYWYFLCTPEDFERPSDVEGAGGTIGGELDALGLPRNVNVAQTDREGFSLDFQAVQCRHNMGDEVEYADIVVDDQTVLLEEQLPFPEEEILGTVPSDRYGVLDVASVTLPEGGYAVIHDSRDGAVMGYSNYLGPGTHFNVPVVVAGPDPFQSPLGVVGMAHTDDPADQQYNFPSEDGPYLDEGGNPVVDPASVEFFFGPL